MSSHEINLSNFEDEDKKENSKTVINQSTIHRSATERNAIHYYSLSDISLDDNEIYYSDSEGSKLLILPKKPNFLHLSSISNISVSGSNKNRSVMLYKQPLAASSPLDKINYVESQRRREKLSLGFKQNKEKRFIETKSNEFKKRFKESTKNENNFATKNIEDNQKLYRNTKIISNNSLTTYSIDTIMKSTKYDKNVLSQTDSSELLQMELSSKMFSGKIKPYMLNLKHDILQLMNNCTLNKQMTCGSKEINDTMRNIFATIKLNKSKCINNEPNKKHQSTLPLVPLIDIDFNTLNELNNKVEHATKILEPVKWMLNNQKEVKKSVKNLDIFKNNDFLKYHLTDNSLGGLKLSKLAKPILDRINDAVSEANDSFSRIRELNNSKTLLPPNTNSVAFNESPQNECLVNISLNYVDECKNIEFSEFIIDVNKSSFINSQVENHSQELNDQNKIKNLVTDFDIPKHNDFLMHHHSDNSLGGLKLPELAKSVSDNINNTISEAKDSLSHFGELSKPNTLQPLNNNSITFHESFQNSHLENNSIHPENDNLVDVNQNRYSLRKRPKSTDHYFVPFKYSIKKKSRSTKTKNKDVFICEGIGKKKKILQYKLHSVLNANSNELMKTICPENSNNDQNTTLFDISNLKPKINVKPCRCGIFPSQVPPAWNNALHKSIHQNLYKLKFNSQMAGKNVVSKSNDNGFLYDIIKINDYIDIDRNLKLTLKNVQDFINLELNFSNNTIKNNHSIFVAVNPDSKIIGYLEVESLSSACIYQNNQLSEDLISVKFGVSKLWVNVKYRNNKVGTRLLKQFCDEENLKTKDIAFAYHGSHGISFINKFFGNNSVLIY